MKASTGLTYIDLSNLQSSIALGEKAFKLLSESESTQSESQSETESQSQTETESQSQFPFPELDIAKTALETYTIQVNISQQVRPSVKLVVSLIPRSIKA